MKRCKTCNEELPLTEYYLVKNKEKEYYQGECKACARERARLYRVKNPKPKTKDRAPRKDGFRTLPKGLRKCGTCAKVMSKDKFYKDNTRASGVSSRCKECSNRYLKARRSRKERPDLEVRRKWSEKNREKLREMDTLYREQNRDILRLRENLRRARKQSLPYTLSEKEFVEILDKFSNKCALCDDDAEAMDHFIPLAIGHGGTIKENIIPLCAKMNSSKHSRNPFEWADAILTNEHKGKFNEVIKYLADLNGLTVEEYREFVFWCFENPRDISEINEENRDSLKLWLRRDLQPIKNKH